MLPMYPYRSEDRSLTKGNKNLAREHHRLNLTGHASSELIDSLRYKHEVKHRSEESGFDSYDS